MDKIIANMRRYKENREQNFSPWLNKQYLPHQ